MRVHNQLGTGYQELIYQRALERALQREGIPFEREKEMPVVFDGEEIGSRRVDFFIADKIMLELKAVGEILPIHKVQTMNYCQMYNLPFGLLINFGSLSLQYHRIYNLNHPLNRTYRKGNTRSAA